MKNKIRKVLLISLTVLTSLMNFNITNVKAEDLNSNERSAIIIEAEKHIGKPYVWGAVGPDSFDCSGYTQYVFSHSIGFTLQRTAEQQRQQLKSEGKEISKTDQSQWKPGDLLFFGNHGEAEHVAIWYGNGKVIHALGDKVQINNFKTLIDKDGQTYEILTVVKTVEDLGGFSILKQDENGNALAGAQFKITLPDGSTRNYTSDSSGKIVFKNIDAGTYKVQEISSPNNYLLDSTERTITVKAGDVASEHVYSFVNKKPTGQITFVKYNDDKSATVPNTSYDVSGPSGYNKRVTTNADGKIILTDLELGTYTFREQQSADGYLLNTSPISITLSYKDQHTSIIYGSAEQSNKEPTATIKIKKQDKEQGVAQGDATLNGAVYQLKAKTDIYNKVGTKKYYSKDEIVAERVTDENGNMQDITSLPLGSYEWKEVTASNGYLVDETSYTIDCTYEGQTVEIVTKAQISLEQVKKQAFQIIKVSTDESEEADKVANVEFTVKLKSEVAKVGWDVARVYDVLKTDKKGYAKSIELPFGTYTVKETKVPSDELLPVPDFEVIIDKDSRESQEWKVMNDAPFKALIKVVKQDAETGKTVLISGTTFKIKNLKTNEYVGHWVWFPFPHYVSEFTTDETGTVTTPDTLDAGEYQVEEIHAPDGYTVDKASIKFTVSNKSAYEMAEDGKTPVITLTKKNVSVKGKVNVTKVGEQLTSVETDKDGNICFNYEDKEVEGAKFVIKANEDILSADNQKDIIYKKGENVTEIVTKKGKAQSITLPLGKYTIEETVAGDSFVLNKEIKNFELKYEDEETSIVFNDVSYKNERQKVEVELTKKDSENGQLLSGAVFGLYAKKDIIGYNGDILVKANELIEKSTSDKNGKAAFLADLPLTEFYTKELNAPIGYASTDVRHDLDATYQGQNVKIITVSALYENDIIKVEVSKKDITTGYELPGAHMTIKEKNGPEYETWVSGDKPHLVIGLEVGKDYELIETSSPYGFSISEKVDFKVSDTGDVQKVEMKDDLVVGKLKWTKTGEVFTHTDIGQTEYGKLETPVFEKRNIIDTEIGIYAAEDIILGNSISYHKKDELIQVLKSTDEAVESKELVVGKYYYIEQVVSGPFVQDNEKHYFEIEDNQSDKIQIIDSELENVRAKVNINLEKVMEEHPYYEQNEAYKDVIFGIFAREDIKNFEDEVGIEKGSMIANCTIDENGHLVNVPDLPIGEFFFKELATNENFVLDEKEYDFEITYEGKDIKEVNIDINDGKKLVNELKRTDIIISKIDKITKEPLSNVEFTLYDKDMNEIMKTISNTDGIAKFEQIPNGIFFCKETKARPEYALSDETIRIELNGQSENNEYHVTMTNVLLPAKSNSVQTGDTTKIGVLISGILISGIVILTTLRIKRKKNGKKK